MQRIKSDRSAGAALVEAAVVVLVLGVVTAIGVYVINHRPTATTNTSTNLPAQPGTTAGIEQLTQANIQTEEQVDKSADSQMQQDALSANTAASNVGGAYNESTL